MQISCLSLPAAWVEQILFNIKLTSGSSFPIRQPPYRARQTQRQEIENHVSDMLQAHLIQPSNRPWSAPMVLVKNKDGSARFCVDYPRSTLSHVRTAIRFLELMTLLMLSPAPSIPVRWTSAAVTIKLKWTKLLSSIQRSPWHRVCTSFVSYHSGCIMHHAPFNAQCTKYTMD